MANIQAAKKAVRSSKSKAVRNSKLKLRLSRITKKTIKLIEMGEIKLAQQQLPQVYKYLDKAARKGVIHANKSNRIKAKLAQQVNSTANNVKTASQNS